MVDRNEAGGIGNPKEGAGSGVAKSSSTTTDEGPKTTRSTESGASIVDDREEAQRVADENSSVNETSKGTNEDITSNKEDTDEVK